MQKTKRLNAFWCVRSLFFAYSKRTAFSDLRSLLFFCIKNTVFSRKCDPCVCVCVCARACVQYGHTCVCVCFCGILALVKNKADYEIKSFSCQLNSQRNYEALNCFRISFLFSRFICLIFRSAPLLLDHSPVLKKLFQSFPSMKWCVRMYSSLNESTPLHALICLKSITQSIQWR